MEIEIRIALESDFSEIYRFIKIELGYANLNETETKKRLSIFAKNDNWATFVAVYDGALVGFVGITKGMAYNIDGCYSQIMALAVLEKYQNAGIGTALLKKAEEWSLSQGIVDIAVNSGMKRLDAHRFYEKNGYSKKSYSFSKVLEK